MRAALQEEDRLRPEFLDASLRRLPVKICAAREVFLVADMLRLGHIGLVALGMPNPRATIDVSGTYLASALFVAAGMGMPMVCFPKAWP
jgi:hypothetical protein